MNVLYITGYKSFELGIFKQNDPAVSFIKKTIKQRLEPLIEEGLQWVIISGQQGTELWAAETVFELQKQYQDIKLAVITPYLNQEEKWNETNREYYQSIIAQADYVDSIYKSPYKSPEQLKMKNRFMIQKSDAMMIIYEEEKDGSPKYVYAEAKKYCETNDYSISQITFDDLQQSAEVDHWNDE